MALSQKTTTFYVPRPPARANRMRVYRQLVASHRGNLVASFVSWNATKILFFWWGVLERMNCVFAEERFKLKSPVDWEYS